MIELIGESSESWQGAVESAVAEAAKTIRNIKNVQVKRMSADVTNGGIVDYKADVEIAFLVDGTS